MMLPLLLLSTEPYITTSYQSVPSQTDSSPFHTSIGERTHPGGCAASQDLLKDGTLKYHDYIWIEGIGLCRINDTMHPRMTRHIDVWVENTRQERAIGIRRTKVWKVGNPQ